MRPRIDYAGEGPADDAIARAMIDAAGGVPGASFRRPSRGNGKQALLASLPGLAAGARHGCPVLALVDLDGDPCAATLALANAPRTGGSRLLVRVCVRESEAWLMADRDAYGAFLDIRPQLLPDQPDTVTHPKRALLVLASIRGAAGFGRTMQQLRREGLLDWQAIGQLNATFAAGDWRPARAARSGRSPSLTRAFERLRAMIVMGRTAQASARKRKSG